MQDAGAGARNGRAAKQCLYCCYALLLCIALRNKTVTRDIGVREEAAQPGQPRSVALRKSVRRGARRLQQRLQGR